MLIDSLVLLSFFSILYVTTRHLPLDDVNYLKMIYAAYIVFFPGLYDRDQKKMAKYWESYHIHKNNDIRGTRASAVSMLIRTAFVFLSAVFIIVDVLWITSDRDRQMVRDKFLGVYVIKKKAKGGLS